MSSNTDLVKASGPEKSLSEAFEVYDQEHGKYKPNVEAERAQSPSVNTKSPFRLGGGEE